MSIDELLNILNSIDPIKEAGIGMEEAKDKVIDLNHQQLLKGQRADGSSLGTYRPFTIAKRREKGRQTSFVDLFYEGDFQNKFDLRVSSDTYEIFSTDSKSDKLQDKYGDNIFGLQVENRLRAWNEFIQPLVVRNLANRYNLAIVSR